MTEEKQGYNADAVGTSLTGRPRQGGDLFIVDNSDETWKAARYLHNWADIAHTFDIATGE